MHEEPQRSEAHRRLAEEMKLGVLRELYDRSLMTREQWERLERMQRERRREER